MRDLEDRYANLGRSMVELVTLLEEARAHPQWSVWAAANPVQSGRVSVLIGYLGGLQEVMRDALVTGQFKEQGQREYYEHQVAALEVIVKENAEGARAIQAQLEQLFQPGYLPPQATEN